MQTDLNGQSEARRERALEVLKTRVPERINDTTYVIPSSDGSTQYKVRHLDAYSCTCPDYVKRCRDNGLYCKHINAIIIFNKLKNKVELDDFDVKDITDTKACPECKSDKLQKYGIRKNKGVPKQRHKCQNCGATFTLDPAKGIKGNARILCLALDMYYKGNSLRDIQDTLYQNFGFRVDYSTISRWNNRFMAKINVYTDNLKPQTSDKMHIDEQVLNIKGKNEWCWNALDSKSRFLLATQITKVRRVKDARAIIQKAKDKLSNKPDFLATDKGPFYTKAVRKEFPTHARIDVFYNKKGVNHVRTKMDNQIIERYHSTFRERDKVMRGFKSEATTQRYLDNWATFYNFVRPHQSFNGMTPAFMAGIDIGNERNRWLGLLKSSSI